MLTLKKAPEAAFLLGRYQLIKSEQTVGDALATFAEKKLRRRRQSIRSLIEGGYATVK